MTVTKQVSLHGKRAFITPDDQVAGRNGFVAGGDDKPSIVFPSPDTVALFDDFLGDLIADEWALVEADTGLTEEITTGTNGVLRLTGTTTVATSAPDTRTAALTQGLVKNWKVNSGGPKNGRLRLSARVKIQTNTRTADAGRTHVFVGFADTGGAEFPAYDTGAGVISNAADCVGFLFSPGGDTGWSLVSAKSTAGDSGDQLAVAGSAYAPTSNVYQTLEIEVRSGNSDTGGVAHFWIDGKKVGRINSPVGSAIALTPWIGMAEQDTGDTAGKYFDIDYIALSAPRDTGM